MNTLGDFGSSGGIPYQTYGPQFHAAVTNPYSLPMPSPSLKSKSTIGYYNGFPIAAAAAAAASMVPTPSKINPTPSNGFGYSNHSIATSEHSVHHTSPRENTSISANGLVHNLPQNMLNDQYGLAGLFVGLKAMKAKCIGPCPDPLCTEVQTEMNAQRNGSNEPLYKRFTGPLSVQAEPESFSPATNHQGVPIYPEYLVTHRMVLESSQPDINYLRNNWTLKPEKFGVDLLFYVFYTFTQDMLQVVAANYLYQKGWRYHMEAKVWMQKVENGVYAKDSENPTKEKGTYVYFDYVNWKTAQIELTLDTSKLEGPPTIPPEFYTPAFPKT